VGKVFLKDAKQRLQGPIDQIPKPLKDCLVCFLLLLKAVHEDRRLNNPRTGLKANKGQVPLDLLPLWCTRGAISTVLDTSASITAFPCVLGGSSEEMV
jgi:hypothetical protein